MELESLIKKENQEVQNRISNLSPLVKLINAGFEHYKGGYYVLVGYSIDEETLRLRVLYLPQNAKIGTIPISRTAERFFGNVDGVYRFNKVSDPFLLFPLILNK